MFFQQFSQIMNPGLDYNFTVSSKDGKLTVLVNPRANGLQDPAQNHLIPFVMTAPPAEMDRLFFPSLQQPIRNASGVIANMVEFEKQAEKAASNSKAKKEAAAKEDKATKEKREKYDKHLKKAGEQITSKDYAGALTSLQQARLHTPGDKEAKAVDQKIAEVKKLSGEGSLFDLPPAENVQQTQTEPVANTVMETVGPPQPTQGTPNQELQMFNPSMPPQGTNHSAPQCYNAPPTNPAQYNGNGQLPMVDILSRVTHKTAVIKAILYKAHTINRSISRPGRPDSPIMDTLRRERQYHQQNPFTARKTTREYPMSKALT